MTTEAVDPRREVILTEIRRVAQTMGGAAPGRQVFERETGIRQGEWLGIYWARWGDALVAARLSANRKNAKLDGATFLARIAQVFRHHRRVPTTSDFRLYRQVDPICPAHSTLDNRFSFPARSVARWPGLAWHWPSNARVLSPVKAVHRGAAGGGERMTGSR